MKSAFLRGFMFPIITIFEKEITMYSVCSLVGIFATMLYSERETKRQKLNGITMLYALLLSSIGIVLGGHILYGIVNFQLIIQLITKFSYIQSIQEFFSLCYYIFGGSVYYGGLFGAILMIKIYFRKTQNSNLGYEDIYAVSIPLFHCFGRIGCFLSGCCYGIESKYGIVYHQALVESANYVRRFPVQLLEAFCNLCIFTILLILLHKKRFRNKLLPLYLLLYAIVRFFLEYLRGDTYRGIWCTFSTSQWISLFILACLGLQKVIVILPFYKKESSNLT